MPSLPRVQAKSPGVASLFQKSSESEKYGTDTAQNAVLTVSMEYRWNVV
ncbi:hypothetical protein [Pandoraea vervacti]|nr:hypothetical protein [Pandoraea vervacti]